MNTAVLAIQQIVSKVLRGVPETARLAIAYSGGMDSHVLLDVAVALRQAKYFVALHVHHGLSAHADAWQNHVQKISEGYQIPCLTKKIALPKKQNLEAQARQARYHALLTMCQALDIHYLLLAHHADDQVETIFLQLMRGTGLPGLSGMSTYFEFSQQSVTAIRPLLSLTREQCLAYAQAKGLQWVEDESNHDVVFKRNAIRQRIMPHFLSHFPAVHQNVQRSAEHAAQAQGLLEDLAELDWQTLQNHHHAISLSALLKLSPARISNVLRYWVKQMGMSAMSNTLLNEVIKQLSDIRQKQFLAIQHDQYCLQVYRDQIFWIPVQNDESKRFAQLPTHQLHWQGESIWHVPGFGRFIFEPTQDEMGDGIAISYFRTGILSIRLRSGGERMQNAYNRPSRSLKNLFQEKGLPHFIRKMPLLYLSETLVYVPFLGFNVKSKNVFNQVDEDGFMRISWQPETQIAHF